jgi:hypothetical protein
LYIKKYTNNFGLYIKICTFTSAETNSLLTIMDALIELKKELSAREKYATLLKTTENKVPMYIRKRITRLKNLIKKLEN